MKKQPIQTSIYEDMTLAEKRVAKFLFAHNLWWMYEQPVFVYDDKERARIWSPDFFLPELGIYIEVCGAERDCYEFRKTIYKKNRVQIVFVETYKDKKWEYFLLQRIKEIQAERTRMIKSLSVNV